MKGKFGKKWSTIVIKCLKYIESKTSWNKLFRNRTPSWSQTLFSQNMFVTSVVGSVCQKSILLVIGDFMTANNFRFTQVLLQQCTSKYCLYESVFEAGLRRHMRVYGVNFNAKDTLLVTYAASLTRVKLAWGVTCIPTDATLPLGVEHSDEGINGCHSRNAKLFEWIEHSGIR